MFGHCWSYVSSRLRTKRIKTYTITSAKVFGSVSLIILLPRLLGFSALSNGALDLIWEAELLADETLPDEWCQGWKDAYIRFQDDRGKLPKGLGPQLNILDLATGTEKTNRQTRYVTKKTYLLIDHLKSLRDVADHSNEYPEIKEVLHRLRGSGPLRRDSVSGELGCRTKEVSIGFVAAALLDAIALVENLAAELKRSPSASWQRPSLDAIALVENLAAELP